jgi:hypothetical protein
MCTAYEVCCGFTGKGSRTVKQTVHTAHNEGSKKGWSFTSTSFVPLHIVLYSLTEEALDNCLKCSHNINNGKQQAKNPVYQKLSVAHIRILFKPKDHISTANVTSRCEQDTH